MEPRGRILWTDDEPGRFRFAEWELTDAGWTVEWARDVETAAHKLAREPFDALILDQMLPFEPSDEADRYWGGCLLLRWLRGAPSPEKATVADARQKEVLGRLSPLPDNTTVPALVVSAFYDEQVVEATRSASRQDREIPFLDKPVDIDEVRRILERPGATHLP